MTPPYATPLIDGTPYTVERRVFAGIPCLIERPLDDVRGLALVYHGVTASKEGNLGIFTALVERGFAVVLPDAVGHGEREEPTLDPAALGQRNFVWLCAARTSLEAPDLIGALHAEYGELPTAAIGISMGGYTAHYLVLREQRVGRVAVISSGGLWQENEVALPLAKDFIERNRPTLHAYLAPPTPLLLLHGENDPLFTWPNFDATVRAYRAVYERAECPDHFGARLFPGVEHYTSPAMQGSAVAWTADLLGS